MPAVRPNLVFIMSDDHAHAGGRGQGGRAERLDQPGAHGPADPVEWELFDLEADPLEVHLRIDDPACAGVRHELVAELATLQEKVGDEPDPEAVLP